MSEQPGGRPGGGKKILGMPRGAVIAGGVVFVAALVWFVIRQGKQQQAAQQAGTPAGQEDFAGEISTLQSEFGDLASEISAMQGGGGSSGGGGSAGGALPAGPPGPAGPAGPAGPPGPHGPSVPARHPNVPVSGMTAHQRHVAHMQHVAHQKRKR